MNIINYYITGIIFFIKAPFLFLKYFIIGLITIISIIPYYLITGLKFLFSKKETIQQSPTNIIQNKLIPIIILTLSITTYLISIFILTRWYVQSERTRNFSNDFISTPTLNQEDLSENTPDQYKDLTSIILPPNANVQTPTTNNSSNTNPPTNTTIINKNFINVNLNYYIQKNPETVAWIQVNGTKVNYPVVQHLDNNYYLKHDFYKRNTTNGWIFGDYRNNFNNFDNNTIIYGHNLINNTMFGSLPDLLNKNWFDNKNNHYIKLSTKTTNSVWQIFSIYKIEPTTDYLQTKFNSTITYQNFLNTIKNRSSYKFDLDINYTDKIITLSTCDNIGTKRVVIHAKLINIETK